MSSRRHVASRYQTCARRMAFSYKVQRYGSVRNTWTYTRRTVFRARVSSQFHTQPRCYLTRRKAANAVFAVPRSILSSLSLLPTSLGPSGICCYAALGSKVLSQTADRPETTVRRTQRLTAETSRSLTTRKTEKAESYAKVQFRIKFRTDYGHQVKIVGSSLPFGAWAVAKCPAMQWNEGDIWSVTIDVPVGNIYEYKYVVVDSHGASVVHWQKGNNCVLAVRMTDKELVVGDNWEGNPGASVTSRGKGITTKEERLLDWADEIRAQSSNSTALVLEKKRELEKEQEENKAMRQEASRLKSELRMASMTRQAAEQQVKELQQENRKLMELLTEQQTVHRNIMEQTLMLIKESETLNSDDDLASMSAELSIDDHPKTTKSAEESPLAAENGSTVSSPSPPQKRRKPRRKSNRSARSSEVSTRTAAVCSPE